MIGVVPDHVPGDAVSVWPCCAVPDTVGGDVFAGAVALAATTAVWAESAVALPAEFEAVTWTRSVEPTSAEATT